MLKIQSYSVIRNGSVSKNGETIFEFGKDGNLSEQLKSLYKELKTDYPKYYKMDKLSKIGLLTSEVLFKDDTPNDKTFENMGVLISNSTASIDTDLAHQASINNRNAYSPSPSIFVYTLPNIVMGEICIRRKIKGENTFLIFDKFETDFIQRYAKLMIDQYEVSHLLIGWIDVLEEKYESFLALISGDENSKQAWSFSAENLNSAYFNNLT